MSTTDYLLNTAAFPEEYAERLIDILAIHPTNFLSIKDALYHFRHLDDDQAAEVMKHIADRIEIRQADGRPNVAAPTLLASLEAILPYAENEAHSLANHKDSPECEAEAEQAWKAVEAAQAAIAQAKAVGILTAPADINIDVVLAARREIAVTWCIADVQGIRPDLSEDQCWEVLENVKSEHDAEYGISWTTLEIWAQQLFPRAPKAVEAREA